MRYVQNVLVDSSEKIYELIKQYRNMKEPESGTCRGILSVKETILFETIEKIIESTCYQYHHAKNYEES